MNLLLLLSIFYVIFPFNGARSQLLENFESQFMNLFNAISQDNLGKIAQYRTKLMNKVGREARVFFNTKNRLKRHEDDGRYNTVELLRRRKGVMDEIEGVLKNDIFKAVLDEDLREVKLFVEVRNVSVKSLNYDKQTPAHSAAYKGNLTILKYLVNIDRSVLEITDALGQTVLHIATEKGPLEMVKFLVDDCKMDVHGINKILSGNAPIHIAAIRGSLDLVKYFVEDKQVDPNILNNLGQPPIFLAAQDVHLHIVKYLYEDRKVNVQVSDKENKNILHMCALRADLKIPKYLLDEKKLTFDINQRDSLGYTIVSWASRRKRMDFIKYFVEEKHADVNIQNDAGWTPLHQAVSLHNMDLIKYLYEHGANFDLKDKDGYTPRNMTEDPEMCDFLNTMKLPTRKRRNVLQYNLWRERNVEGDAEIGRRINARVPQFTNFYTFAKKINQLIL